MNGKIRIAGTVNDSIVDGPGIRFTIFTQGCNHHCKNCHNPQTRDLNDGFVVSIEDILKDIKKNPLLQGITISGGEPFLQSEECLELVKETKEFNSELDVIIYSGYTYDELIEFASKNKNMRDLLEICDYLVDGKYEEDKRDLSLKFRGSKNQKIINLKTKEETDFK